MNTSDAALGMPPARSASNEWIIVPPGRLGCAFGHKAYRADRGCSIAADLARGAAEEPRRAKFRSWAAYRLLDEALMERRSTFDLLDDAESLGTGLDLLLSVPVLFVLLSLLVLWAISPRLGHRVAAMVLYPPRPAKS